MNRLFFFTGGAVGRVGWSCGSDRYVLPFVKNTIFRHFWDRDADVPAQENSFEHRRIASAWPFCRWVRGGARSTAWLKRGWMVLETVPLDEPDLSHAASSCFKLLPVHNKGSLQRVHLRENKLLKFCLKYEIVLP